jgi:hypothetical protein
MVKLIFPFITQEEKSHGSRPGMRADYSADTIDHDPTVE